MTTKTTRRHILAGMAGGAVAGAAGTAVAAIPATDPLVALEVELLEADAAWSKVQIEEEVACFARVKMWKSSKEPWNAQRAVLKSYLRYFPEGANADRVKDWLDGIERKISALEQG